MLGFLKNLNLTHPRWYSKSQSNKIIQSTHNAYVLGFFGYTFRLSFEPSQVLRLDDGSKKLHFWFVLTELLYLIVRFFAVVILRLSLLHENTRYEPGYLRYDAVWICIPVIQILRRLLPLSSRYSKNDFISLTTVNCTQ
jgi:hypothetical protein